MSDAWRNGPEHLRDRFRPLPQPERPATDGLNDWVFVTHEGTRGWILDAICREIGSRQSGTWVVSYAPRHLPKGRNYFFSHYAVYLERLRHNPHIFDGNVFVWYTHPREIPFTVEEEIKGYNRATQVVFPCSMFQRELFTRGLDRSRGTVVLGAADPNLFPEHRRGAGGIGVSSAFYERKNPDILLDLVRLLPNRQFYLVGKGWDKYGRFSELCAEPNFTYFSVPYSEYPAVYKNFDVFVSLSVLEGGPIPLMESMMCNAVPVASRTGFAPDIIRHGENGFLFDVGLPAKDIVPLIELAFETKADVRSTVRKYTWDAFARQIHGLARVSRNAEQ